MSVRHMVVRRALAGAVAVTAVAASVAVVAGPGQADTSPSPAGPGNPETVSATPLPTVQINGVAWSQAIIGNTVYVGGEFTQARPAGARPGTRQTPRKNLLAYDIRTGKLITSWVANTNGDVRVVRAAPDGSRLYVGGAFTQVNGVARARLAALNPVTGAVVSKWNPRPDAQVKAIAFRPGTVYFGGNFGAVAGQKRYGLAAVRASDAGLLNWAPVARGGVAALAVSPDGSQVLAGGQFTSMNGSSNPGRGLAALDAVSGTNRPWKANDLIRAGGDGSGITDLVSSGNSVYATGFNVGTADQGRGTLEGAVRMSWSGGAIEWLQDCHGDSYGVSVQGGVVYVASHAHYCGNVPSGFHTSDPRNFRRAMAFSQQATQQLRADYLGERKSFPGVPAPSLLHWFPRIEPGSYTGTDQGAWTIEGNKNFIVVGGEFPQVGTRAQQGLVRFAKKGVSSNPNNTGTGTGWGPLGRRPVSSPAPGEVVVSWPANWDRDNANLTYRVIRNGATARPVATRTARSTEWNRPYLSYLDTGLKPGSTVSYRIDAVDPDGHVEKSKSVSVTVSRSGAATDGYARSVLASGPQSYWRLSERSGRSVADYTGFDVAVARNGVTRGVAGVTDGDYAAQLKGSLQQGASTGVPRTSSFASSVEAWVKTTSTSGGKIVGFGDQRTGSSSSSKVGPHLYMDNAGRAHFGVWQGSNRVVSSGAGLNDGKWHHLVGTVGDAGLVLYVDGKQVGSRADTTAGREFTGYWRIGGDTLSGWPNRPSSDYFTGTVAEVAVYSHQISATQASNHYSAATSSGSAGSYVPVVPVRLLDTRSGVGVSAGAVGAGGSVALPVTGRGGVPGSGVSAVVLNVTATAPSAGTYVTVWPSGVARPVASSLNVGAGQTRANLVTVPVGSDGRVRLFNNSGRVHLIADVQGYYRDGGGGSLFHPDSPWRLYDSRKSSAGALGAGAQRCVAVSRSGYGQASAVALNVTVTSPSAGTYLTVWPQGKPRPVASNVNVVAGQTAPNAVITGLSGSRQFCVYNNSGRAHVVVDVHGFYAGASVAGGLAFHPVTPVRVLDTRDGTGTVSRSGVLTSAGMTAGVGSAAAGDAGRVKAVVGNLTGTQPSAATYVTAWPAGESRPFASSLNLVPGETAANMVQLRTGSDGRVGLYTNAGRTHTILDISGWFG